jgi:hypothetical protein
VFQAEMPGDFFERGGGRINEVCGCRGRNAENCEGQEEDKVQKASAYWSCQSFLKMHELVDTRARGMYFTAIAVQPT